MDDFHVNNQYKRQLYLFPKAVAKVSSIEIWDDAETAYRWKHALSFLQKPKKPILFCTKQLQAINFLWLFYHSHLLLQP
jgi:hypothetical protein